jgi:hypothetical protein
MDDLADEPDTSGCPVASHESARLKSGHEPLDIVPLSVDEVSESARIALEEAYVIGHDFEHDEKRPLFHGRPVEGLVPKDTVRGTAPGVGHLYLRRKRCEVPRRQSLRDCGRGQNGDARPGIPRASWTALASLSIIGRLPRLVRGVELELDERTAHAASGNVRRK